MTTEVETWLPTEWEVFYTDGGKAYVDVQEGGYRQTYLIRGKEFSEFLMHRNYNLNKEVIKTQKLKELLELLEAKAKFEGPKRDVYLRLAEHEGKIYLDLGRSDWSVVEIDPEGWRIVPAPAVRFRRSKGLQPLPLPEHGGQVNKLLQVLNVDPENWPLVAAWLVAALNPRGPYPLLVLNGEQGSGKSSLARMLKGLIDPSQGSLRSEPRKERDLMLAADHNWVLSFDNLSKLPVQLSDALCRLSTGGSFATRRLYSNDEEIVLEAARPLILTSIEELVVRGDLLDRSLCVNLPIISEEKRRTEREVLAQYEELKPRVLGALLDTVSLALRERDKVKLEQLPRMADFAIWVVAAELGLGLERGDFMKAYNKSREAGHEKALEDSPVALAVRALLENQDVWEGKATNLLQVLHNHADRHASKGDRWPKVPNKLSNELRRSTSDLRSIGVEVTFIRQGKEGARIVRLEKVREQPSALSVDTKKITPDHQGESKTEVYSSVPSASDNLRQPTDSLTDEQNACVQGISELTDEADDTDTNFCTLTRTKKGESKTEVYSSVPSASDNLRQPTDSLTDGQNACVQGISELTDEADDTDTNFFAIQATQTAECEIETTETTDYLDSAPEDDLLASVPQKEPVEEAAITTLTRDAVASEPVEPASQPEASDGASTASLQPLVADWDLQTNRR